MVGLIKSKIAFQKLFNDRVAIFYGKKLVDIISESQLIEYLNNKDLDTKKFETSL